MSTETQLVIAVLVEAIAIAVTWGYLWLDANRWSKDRGEDTVRRMARRGRAAACSDCGRSIKTQRAREETLT